MPGQAGGAQDSHHRTVLWVRGVARLWVTLEEPEQRMAVGASGGDLLGMLGRRKPGIGAGLGDRCIWQASAG